MSFGCFAGTAIKLFKDQLYLSTTARILTGTVDPTSVAQDAQAGSLYMRVGSINLLYQKQDAGLTTNWLALGTGTLVDYLDPISTTLPNVGGTSVTFDNGNSAVNGDLILFSNLTVNKNSVYKISGVGSSIVYTLVTTFGSAKTGTEVMFRKGSAYINQVATFNGTSFLINDIIRMFDSSTGNVNYVEIDSIKTTTVPANASSYVLFSVNATGTENLLIYYSLSGSFGKVIGQLMITQDGTNVAVVDSNATAGNSLVTFDANLNAGNVRLLVNSTDAANIGMKYTTWRWSDTAGGPTGIPNYTGAINSSTVSAAGVTGNIQFKGVSGNLDADPNLNWDSSADAISLNGYKIGTLQNFTILDNQVSPQGVFSFAAGTRRFMLIDYSLERDIGSGHLDTQVGQIMLASNTVTASLTDAHTYTGILGITFSAFFSSGTVYLRYISTSTSNNAAMKYSIREWN